MPTIFYDTTQIMNLDLNMTSTNAYLTDNVSMDSINCSIMECSCHTNEDPAYLDFYLTAKFVTGLIIYPICCVVGITGNILALIVLNHPDMRTSTNVYLSSLAVSDTLKLLNDAGYFIIVLVGQSDQDLSDKMTSTVYPVAHYVFNMSVCVTAWLTVSVAVERYISVCYASRAKQLCTIPRARLVCTCVFITMGILAVPSALRYEMVTIFNPILNVTCVETHPTELGQNESFMVPWSWIQNCLRGIVPVFVLIFLNARIINELRKERVKGKKFSARNRITLMLIVIIFMFLICITPDAIMSTFFGKGYIDEDNLSRGVREMTDTLICVNSAFTFIVYCTMSRIFRKTFVKIFCQFAQKHYDARAIQMACAEANKAKFQEKQHVEASPQQNNDCEMAQDRKLLDTHVVRVNGCATVEDDGEGREEYL